MSEIVLVTYALSHAVFGCEILAQRVLYLPCLAEISQHTSSTVQALWEALTDRRPVPPGDNSFSRQAGPPAAANRPGEPSFSFVRRELALNLKTLPENKRLPEALEVAVRSAAKAISVQVDETLLRELGKLDGVAASPSGDAVAAASSRCRTAVTSVLDSAVEKAMRDLAWMAMASVGKPIASLASAPGTSALLRKDDPRAKCPSQHCLASAAEPSAGAGISALLAQHAKGALEGLEKRRNSRVALDPPFSPSAEASRQSEAGARSEGDEHAIEMTDTAGPSAERHGGVVARLRSCLADDDTTHELYSGGGLCMEPSPGSSKVRSLTRGVTRGVGRRASSMATASSAGAGAPNKQVRMMASQLRTPPNGNEVDTTDSRPAASPERSIDEPLEVAPDASRVQASPTGTTASLSLRKASVGSSADSLRGAGSRRTSIIPNPLQAMYSSKEDRAVRRALRAGHSVTDAVTMRGASRNSVTSRHSVAASTSSLDDNTAGAGACAGANASDPAPRALRRQATSPSCCSDQLGDRSSHGLILSLAEASTGPQGGRKARACSPSESSKCSSFHPRRGSTKEKRESIAKVSSGEGTIAHLLATGLEREQWQEDSGSHVEFAETSAKASTKAFVPPSQAWDQVRAAHNASSHEPT